MLRSTRARAAARLDRETPTGGISPKDVFARHSKRSTGGTNERCFDVYSRLEQVYRMPADLSSATHHMGLEVSTYTVSSSGTKWFDVDTSPSNPDNWFAMKKHLKNLQLCSYLRGLYALKFHLSPAVVSTVESTPTGSSPQVGPSIEWSIEMRCLP